MSKKKMEIIGLLKTVLEDCQSQVDHLNEREDVCWDCYHVDNWQAMVESLEEAIKRIKNG